MKYKEYLEQEQTSVFSQIEDLSQKGIPVSEMRKLLDTWFGFDWVSIERDHPELINSLARGFLTPFIPVQIPLDRSHFQLGVIGSFRKEGYGAVASMLEAMAKEFFKIVYTYPGEFVGYGLPRALMCLHPESKAYYEREMNFVKQINPTLR